MLQHVSRSTGRAALVGTLIAASALVMADDKPSSTQERKDSNPGKTSGVILRVEPIEHGDQARKRSWRVTVNSDVVWRDFVRDQRFPEEPKPLQDKDLRVHYFAKKSLSWYAPNIRP